MVDQKKWRFANALPEPDFRYFSNAVAFLSLLESKVNNELPRSELGGMRQMAVVVVENSLFEIGCVSDIRHTALSDEISILRDRRIASSFGEFIWGDACYLAGLPAVAWFAAGVRLRQGYGGRSSLRLRCAPSEGWSG